MFRITSGSNSAAAEVVDDLYKEIVTAGTYKVESIQIAEAAKVIENILSIGAKKPTSDC